MTAAGGTAPGGPVAPPAVVGLVLAGGGGRRLGGRPKALLEDAAGTPLLRATAEALLAAGCAEVVVVLGAAPEAAGSLDGLVGVRTVVAPDWQEGIGASLRHGLGAIAADGPAAVLVTLADLPDVGAPVMRRVVTAWRDRGARADDLLRASFGGRPGHPVLLGPDHREPLRAVASGDAGAQPYLRGRRVREVECDDLATGRDLDRPEDLTAWGAR